MDEFRAEREAIKHGTPKQKYQYFKDYYRMPLIIFVLSAVFIGLLVYNFVSGKDSAFYAAMLNCSPFEENEWFPDEYAETAGIDLDDYEITFDTEFYFKLNSNDENTYFTTQKHETYAGAGQLDVMLGSGDEFAYFANSVLFKDLREVLSVEQLERYEPYFYYIDTAIFESLSGLDFDPDNIPDPKDPESMTDPVPVAIYVDGSNALNKAYYFKNVEDGIALGIYVNTSHLDNTLKFIDYIMSDISD